MKKEPTSSQTIALFIPTLKGGGAERVMVMIANGLAADGLRVDLLTGSSVGPYRASISDQVNLIDFGVTRLLASLPLLARYLWKNKPKTVLSALDHANVASVILSKMLTPETKLVVSVHNSLRSTPPIKLIPRVTYFLSGWALSKADRVVSVSEGIRGQLLKRHKLDPQRVITIYNPLDVEAISKSTSEPSGKEWLDYPELPVIIGVGRLTEQKNFELLIRAFSNVRTRIPSKLVILGEGEERAHLEKIVRLLGLERDVELPGFVENPFAWVSKSTVFVLSSGWEGLPGALLEALACGTQVVSTDCETGPREILEDGKWGRLVEVGDKDCLADAIVETLEQTEPIDTTARARDFSKEHAVASYLKILASGDE